MSSWIARTMENMDQLLEAIKFKATSEDLPFKPSDAELQEAYINSSLERCRRCGDHTFTIMPSGLATLCSACEADLREMEEKALTKRPFWFYEMVQKASKKTAKGGK